MGEGMTLWAWDDVSKIWVKAPAVSIPKRMTGTGLVVSGEHKLCWLACTPSAGLSLWELTNAIVSGKTVVLDCYSTARESKMGNFTPPILFTTGIYLETFTNMTSITIGYI